MSSKSSRAPAKRAPAKGEIDLALAAQMKAEREARAAQAVGGEAAPDSVEIGGVRFFQPTLAHVWFCNRIRQSPVGFGSLIDLGACLVASLTMPQAEVRNTLMPAIDRGGVTQFCYDRLIDFGVTVETLNDAYEQLWQPLVDPQSADPNGRTPPASSPAGGEE